MIRETKKAFRQAWLRNEAESCDAFLWCKNAVFIQNLSCRESHDYFLDIISENRRPSPKFPIFKFSSIFCFFEFFMAVLGPGRVSMAFPGSVRSFFTPQCPKPTHLDPIQPQNYIFRNIFHHFSKLFRKNTSHINPQTKPIG